MSEREERKWKRGEKGSKEDDEGANKKKKERVHP
jgi:hypothetical protein